MSTYYYIIDKKMVGRTDGPGYCNAYLYKPGQGWVPDTNTISDRLIGYDPYERGIGHTSVMDNIRVIQEEEALQRIKNYNAERFCVKRKKSYTEYGENNE